MRLSRVWQTGFWCVALCVAAQLASAITLQIDYTYDTGNFFGSGNPSGATAGAQAKAALEAAASYYSTILTDTFDPIVVPPQFHSTFPGSTSAVSWSWTATFPNPTTGVTVNATSIPVASDQYIIYAGARALGGSTAGIGGPGGYVTASTTQTGSGGYTPGDVSNITTITNTLNNAITTRGEPSGFSRWGGAITFDNDGSTQWFYNYLGTPSGNVSDFYSVALHELGHSLGLGVSADWNVFVSGSSFVGPNAEAQNGGPPVPLSPDLGHWAANTQSIVYGTSVQQEALMDPDLTNGTRKRVTALDAAALQDIGWSLGPAPGVNGDYDGNGIVDASDYAIWRKRLNQNVTLPNDTTPGTVTAADYTVWRANFGKVASGSGSGSSLASGEVPEPASGVLATLLVICVYFNRRTPRR
jgi:hypothetical protein